MVINLNYDGPLAFTVARGQKARPYKNNMVSNLVLQSELDICDISSWRLIAEPGYQGQEIMVHHGAGVKGKGNSKYLTDEFYALEAHKQSKPYLHATITAYPLAIYSSPLEPFLLPPVADFEVLEKNGYLWFRLNGESCTQGPKAEFDVLSQYGYLLTLLLNTK